ncbi:hypothetical protein GCM10022226_37710 [Sphaerisporangium flaviroseum]|uniref:Uncharacterized protein n=1 Tax=Sphaerisporangium flaviroseum TaxID=509199 RepID=A0ABP7IAB1_9ACTN
MDVGSCSEVLASAHECTSASKAVARAAGDPRLLCLALNARYWVAFVPGHPDGLEALGQELLAVSARGGLLGYQRTR